MTAPVQQHEAKAWRRASGWIRWFAICPDCDFSKPGGSREGAQQLADAHNRASMRVAS